MTLTKYGRREWGIATAVAVVLLAGTISCGFLFTSNAGFYLSILVVAVWAAFVGFFRDPARSITTQDDLLLSPADGLVKDIELIRAADCPQLAEVFEGRDMLRVGIFLSVFNVHLNRAPAGDQGKRISDACGNRHRCRKRISDCGQADLRSDCAPDRLRSRTGNQASARGKIRHDQIRFTHRALYSGKKRS